MDKKEIFEELRRNVLKEIQGRDLSREQIMILIEKDIDKVIKVYESYGCNYKPIEEYLTAKKAEMKSIVDSTCDERKGEMLQQMDFILKKIQNDTEEKQTEEYKNIGKLSTIETHDRKQVIKIVNGFTNCLRDAKTHANRILSYRGFSDNRIEQIDGNIIGVINKLETQIQNETDYIFSKDKQEIISKVVEEYQTSLDIIRKIDRLNSDEKQQFREKMKSGESLKEQKEFVDNILKDEPKKQNTLDDLDKVFPALPDDLII